MRKILILLFLIAKLSDGLGQSDGRFGDFLNCEESFLKKEISADIYLQKADSLLKVNILKKATTSTDSLIFLLKTYKKTAWTEPQFQKYRSSYYRFLTRNSQTAGRGGEAIFYAAKYATELAKDKKKDAFEVNIKLGYLIRNENFNEVINTFENDKKYLESIWINVGQSEFTDEDSQQAFGILTSVSYASVELGNLKKAREILGIANRMRTIVQMNNTLPNVAKVNAVLRCFYIDFYILLSEGKHNEAHKILQQCDSVLSKNNKILGPTALYHLDRLKGHKLQYYIKTGQASEAIRLLEVKQKGRFEDYYDNMIDAETRGRLAAMQKDYKLGYEMLFTALNLQRKEYTTISKEMNDLLYSHAEAESKRSELEEANQEKDKQRNLTIVITLLSGASIITALIFLNKEKRTSRKKIQELNRTASIEIEEVIVRASKEERKKIGQDLHDGLSGSMAGILYHLEDIKAKTQGSELNSEVANLYDKLQLVSKELRQKSHLNFNALYDTKEDSLEASVEKIVNSALKPTTKREIDIDKETAVFLSISTRIEILRIVQEALTNIVKHAKKVTEVFIYLYNNEGSIYLEIGNNGVISDNKHTDGIGIRSIKSRVLALGGETKVEYEGIGFKIEIKLPKPQHL